MSGAILVTGGAGFIGSAFVRSAPPHGRRMIVLDKLTYAGDLKRLEEAKPWMEFVHGDINDGALVYSLLDKWKPRALVHFAAESHVDRSISGPADFVQTNVMGTFALLDAVRLYLKGNGRDFRFLHISTDEVYGSLGPEEAPWAEDRPLCPNNPYSASKAAAEHFVRVAWRTHGVPVLIARCCNNYGPGQHPEKLIPKTILSLRSGSPITIHGNGSHVRDWIHVEDHVAALWTILAGGRVGETYNVAGRSTAAVREIVDLLCGLYPGGWEGRIVEIEDRPGNDWRYESDDGKLRAFGWAPAWDLTSGLEQTMRSYE